MSNSVLFPAPEGPMMAVSSPARNSPLMFCRMSRPAIQKETNDYQNDKQKPRSSDLWSLLLQSPDNHSITPTDNHCEPEIACKKSWTSVRQPNVVDLIRPHGNLDKTKDRDLDNGCFAYSARRHLRYLWPSTVVVVLSPDPTRTGKQRMHILPIWQRPIPSL